MTTSKALRCFAKTEAVDRRQGWWQVGGHPHSGTLENRISNSPPETQTSLLVTALNWVLPDSSVYSICSREAAKLFTPWGMGPHFTWLCLSTCDAESDQMAFGQIIFFTSMNPGVHVSKMDIHLVSSQVPGKSIRDHVCCVRHMLVDSEFSSNVLSHPVSPR